MRYTVVLTDEVRDKLRSFPMRLRREIGHKLFLLEEDLSGNVKKLKGSRNQYRLRTGDYRIPFELEGRTVTGMLSGTAKVSTDEHHIFEAETRDCESTRHRRDR